ncbi:T9SS type A sorting domain-containing protein [Haloflavibacter putidus]|uniref:T9SS type A sorting domain-containing protein n=1 Tax=Haloflavibacter putidus TaxID=2576776 RepID=A0A507ZNW3_9FLAO|nr:T9SS type A sorting domain-containing protein [Haloflavibacter putidus]TQD38677.1 T9SS type A sorting domain-containing protein [Haloflavibacter putidus]
MKKITLLAFAFLASVALQAQDVLTHSTDNSYMDYGSVACAADPDDTSGTGDESSSDNVYYRAYTPSNFGYSGDFRVLGSQFFISFVDGGGTNPTHTVTVNFSLSTGSFPAGSLVPLASKTVDLTVADHNTLVEVLLDNPLDLNATDEIVVSLDIPDAPDAPNNYDIRIGINEAGEDAPSYLSSEACGITTPSTTASIGFPDNAILLDLIGTDNLAVDSEELENNISLYPNPVNERLNVEVSNSIQVTSATMFDVLGKSNPVQLNNGVINTSSLAAGVYILQLETNQGTLTKKIVKK